MRKTFDRSPSGFTLVEMLVVIVIIAMLAGLLVPAVLGARERTRQAKCTDNQKNLALAVQQYELAKGHLPGYLNRIGTIPNTDPAEPIVVSWVPPLLPYLERNDLWPMWRSGEAMLDADGDGIPDGHVFLELTVCPSNPPERTSVGATPLDYVVNCGMWDGEDPESGFMLGDAGPPPVPPDFTRNGLFHNHDDASVTPVAVRVQMTFADIADGPQQTLMISENLAAGNWTDVDDRASIIWNERVEGKLGFMWKLASSSGELGQFRIQSALPPPTSPNPATDLPPYPGNLSSNHNGGVVVSFADAHQKFLNEDIDYRVYQLLMTPDSQAARRQVLLNNPSDDYNLAGSLGEGDY